MNSFPRIFLSRPALVAAVALTVAAALAAACGSGSASTPGASPTSSASAGDARQGFRNRTPRPEIQTAIALGTPFGNRTPFADRTPNPDIQTAIAEGTPAGPPAAQGLKPGPAARVAEERARLLAAAATVLAIDETQLRSELQAPGATLERVAAAHGQQRAAFRQALIDATKKRLSDDVANGTLAQDVADQIESNFESGLDRLLDNPGAVFAEPTPPAP